MTTINDKMKAQIQEKGDYALAAGVAPIASGDPNNVNPIPDHQGESSINKAATGKIRHQLGGLNGNADINVEPEYDTAEYPSCQTNETTSGHVIELDDTRGQERVLIKHNTGAGIEMRSDGSIIVSTVNHKITIVNGDKTVKVAGDARMIYEGNLSVEVAGDYNLVVKGNMNTTVKGDVVSNCDNRSENVDGNSKDIVKGHRSVTSLKTNADLTMGDRDIVTKGNTDIISSGEATLASTGDLKLSSEARIFGAATTAIQMGSAKMNLMGATGTIGGEGVIAYVNNIYGTSGTFTEGVTAPTFHGNLNGLAKEASESYHQNYPDGTAAPSTYTPSVGSPNWSDPTHNTATNTEATFEPRAANMESYTTGVYGVNDIQIDLGDHLKNAIDQTVKSSGKSKSVQTIEEVRSSLKDEANLNDKTYTANAVASGTLNPEYLNTIPGETGRIVNTEPTEVQPKMMVQRGKDRLVQGRKVKPRNNQKQVTVDPLYNPMKEIYGITPKTKLAKGITIAKFLGGKGDGTTLNHITAETDKQQLARNLYMHAYAMSLVNDDEGKFSGNSLIVDECVYKAGPNETPTANGINDLAKDGRAIAYKLYSSAGQVDNIGLFDLAIYWKDNLLYEKIICDFDKFHPDNTLDFQLILIMPTISEDFTGTFSKNLETKYNGKVMSSGELIEIF